MKRRIRGKIKKHQFKSEAQALFQGELMTCRNCGKQRRSDPDVESNWNFIEIPEDHIGFYICPECFANWIKRRPTKQ